MADSGAFIEYMDLLTTATRRDLDEDEIARFNELGEGGGIDSVGELLGVAYRAAGPRGASTAFTADRRHLQPWGLVNGGVFAAVGESLGSVSGFLAGGGEAMIVGANNSTDFFRPGRPGMTIVSTSEPVHLGRTSQVWEIRHVDEASGKLLARTTLRLAVLRER